MIRPDTKSKTPAKLSRLVLKFVNKGSLYATAHEQSWSSFFYQDNPSTKVPTYAVLDDQSPDAFFLQIPCSNSRSGRPRNEPVNKYDYRH